MAAKVTQEGAHTTHFPKASLLSQEIPSLPCCPDPHTFLQLPFGLGFLELL